MKTTSSNIFLARLSELKFSSRVENLHKINPIDEPDIGLILGIVGHI